MRLISTYYRDFYPFLGSGLFSHKDATNNPDELTKDDCLLVWGGADIWPGFYNKKLSQRSYAGTTPSQRDTVEWDMMKRAKELGIPIIGVCRGAQMLCALAGGYLMQHINGHGGASHGVKTYTGEIFPVNSLHHQMMVAPKHVKHEIIAETPIPLSSVYWDEDENKVDHKQEPEFIYFNDVKGFAIQWHPEMMPSNVRATEFIFEEIKKRV